ncbi:MAG: helix-turn-helix transcriptional regulator [Magnetococcales bacterium]|nr:helix-turn-helix transcriptional regulator [Magnetococcales bacterium]
MRSFARKTGISDTAIRHYLAGKGEPSLSKLIAVAQASELNLLWLATGEGSMRAGEEETPRPGDGSIPGYPEIDAAMIIQAMDAVEGHLKGEGSDIRAGAMRPLVVALCKRAVERRRAEGGKAGGAVVDLEEMRELFELAS